MDLTKAFDEIDIDRSGEITPDELRKYMIRENYDDGLINKWMDLFDKDGNGKINYEEYCKVLDLEANKEYLSEFNERREESALMDKDEVVIDVEIYKEDPSTDDDFRQFVIDISHQAASEHQLEKDIARQIKVKLDDKYGRIWHSAVSKTTFGCNLSHLPGGFMHYKIEEYCYLIWKTPAL